jgi:hypothetical protein
MIADPEYLNWIMDGLCYSDYKKTVFLYNRVKLLRVSSAGPSFLNPEHAGLISSDTFFLWLFLYRYLKNHLKYLILLLLSGNSLHFSFRQIGA